MGAFCRRGTEGLERGGAPFMRAQAPACGRRLIDGPSDQRVPEAKPAGHVGLANEVQPEEGVQSLERYRLRDGRGGRRKLGFEWVTRHGGSLKHEACFI